MFTVFLKNRNFISKIKISKVTDYAALIHAVIDHCSKMVGINVDQIYEIWAYIKARSKLGCSLKQLMTEISTT